MPAEDRVDLRDIFSHDSWLAWLPCFTSAWINMFFPVGKLTRKLSSHCKIGYNGYAISLFLDFI